ncbi:MAG: cytochrome c [Flammeovirgaceae bacterium]|nr:cytochrome c [Flammeovirgaceae bacterium]
MRKGLLVLIVGVLFSAWSCQSKKEETAKKEEPVVKEKPKPAAPTAEDVVAAGEKVYNTYCMVCHQKDGNGVVGMNPPLTQTKYVLGDKAGLIKIVLGGLSGDIEVKGEMYSNVMPPHNFLNDKQVSDVLTFVRSSFGNDADAVSKEEVAIVRAEQETK